MADGSDHKNIKMPFVMRPTSFGRISVVLGLLCSLVFVDADIRSWGRHPIWIDGLVLGVVALLDLWFISNLASITVRDRGIQYSLLGLTYSRIPWESIRRVVYQDSGSIQNSQPRYYIYHDGSFLGFPAGVNIYMYRREDLSVVLSAIRQNTRHVKYSMGRS